MVGSLSESIEGTYVVRVRRAIRGSKVVKMVSASEVAHLAMNVLVGETGNSRTSFRVFAVEEWIVLEVRYEFGNATNGGYHFPEKIRKEFFHALKNRYGLTNIYEIGVSTRVWTGTWP